MKQNFLKEKNYIQKYKKKSTLTNTHTYFNLFNEHVEAYKQLSAIVKVFSCFFSFYISELLQNVKHKYKHK